MDGIEVDKTFTDKASGKDTKRPQLELMMSFVRSGDTVIVHSTDRLACNVDDLRRIVQTLTARGMHIEFVKEHLAFTGEDSPIVHNAYKIVLKGESMRKRKAKLTTATALE